MMNAGLDHGRKRCDWALSSELEKHYHDTEWGVVSRDDRYLFEMLILEGAQAGLSWATILRKRASYREAYHDFEVARVAHFTTRTVQRLLGNPGIVRNRLKIEASIRNARAFLKVQDECGSFANFAWGFTGGRPVVNRWNSPHDVPSETETSRALSAALKQRGFSFVGPTICYAFMQSTGMVNDHEVACFRHGELT
jgi:DNA-3-methyladenine glycosylase I